MAKGQMTIEAPKEKPVDLATIKTAILSNCGGWNGASDGEYLAKWKSLSPEQRAAYLKDNAKWSASDD